MRWSARRPAGTVAAPPAATAKVVVDGAGAPLIAVGLHTSSGQGADDVLWGDGQRGGAGVEGFAKFVPCQVVEHLTQMGPRELGSGEG